MRLRADNKGFTLIEILVVLALTLIVMGLIFGPLIQTFKLTRQAETIIRAQDNARMALAQVSRDLSNAMYVYDNTHDSMSFPVLNAMGNPVTKQVLFAKVDLVLPRMRGYCPNNTLHTPGGIQRGQEAAPVCPICGDPLELKPIEPLVPDTNIVRYFIGLKDPTLPYFNGFNSKLAEADKQDNTYVLYRVEFNPFDSRLFENADQVHFNDNLRDKDFFYNPAYAAAWRNISRPVVTLNDIDLVIIEFDADGNPVVTPTVKFSPTAIYNDPLVPTSGAEDDPDRGGAPPTVFRASYGHWVLPYKVILDAGGGTIYETMPGLGGIGSQDPPTHMCIYRMGVTGKPVQFVFNITHYLNTRDASPYGVGELWPATLANREKAFIVDTLKGTVNCAFPNCFESTSNSYCTTLNGLLGVDGHSVSVRVGGYAALSEVASSKTIIDAIKDDLDAGNPPKAHPMLVNLQDTSPPTVLSNATVVPGSVRVIYAPDNPDLNRLPKPVYYTKSALLTQDPGTDQFAVDIQHDENLSDAACPGAAAIYFREPRTAELITDYPFPTKDLRLKRNDDGKNDILIYYQVQNNKKGDLLRANYVTKDLMTVIMGIRIYDTNSGKVQAIQLTNKMRLRNIAE